MDVLDCGAGDPFFLAGFKLYSLDERDIESAAVGEHGPSVSALQQALLFEFGKIFADRDLANRKSLRQVLHLNVTLVLEEAKDLVPSIFGSRKQRWIGFRFQSALDVISH